MSARKPKVLVAMSGGVDSSVTAALLMRTGYEVVGVFMRLGSPGESLDELIEDNEPRPSGSGSCQVSNRQPLPDGCGSSRSIRIGHQGCCSINDAADARLVAAKLSIPFYVVNFKKDFGRIIDYFVGEYNAGRTPNPCVRCNDWLKFGKLHQYAKQIEADFVASGHYARIDWSPIPSVSPRLCRGDDGHVRTSRARTHPTFAPPAEPGANGEQGEGAPRLLRGIDHDKDQSYVLFGAPRARLREMLLPIGGYRKSEVRRLAAEFDLPVFNKPDSQEICFVPDNDYAGLVQRQTPEAVQRGPITDRDGRMLGEHDGHQHFTIGQRKGVRLALGRPVYVVDKNAATNTIVVGEKDDLLRSGCAAAQTNWLVDEPPPGQWRECTAKIRYNADPIPAEVRAVDADRIEVRFAQPQEAVAPGQAVVCYDGEVVICGGWIDRAI